MDKQLESLSNVFHTLKVRFYAQQRSILRRVSLWGGVFALVIAICTGLFQLYDGFVLRNRATFEANQQELAGYVSRIAQLNSGIASLQTQALESSNISALEQEIGVLNLEKISNIRLADVLIERRPNIGNFAAYFYSCTRKILFYLKDQQASFKIWSES